MKLSNLSILNIGLTLFSISNLGWAGPGGEYCANALVKIGGGGSYSFSRPKPTLSGITDGFSSISPSSTLPPAKFESMWDLHTQAVDGLARKSLAQSSNADLIKKINAAAGHVDVIKMIYDAPNRALDISRIARKLDIFDHNQMQSIHAAALKVEQGISVKAATHTDSKSTSRANKEPKQADAVANPSQQSHDYVQNLSDGTSSPSKWMLPADLVGNTASYQSRHYSAYEKAQAILDQNSADARQLRQKQIAENDAKTQEMREKLRRQYFELVHERTEAAGLVELNKLFGFSGTSKNNALDRLPAFAIKISPPYIPPAFKPLKIEREVLLTLVGRAESYADVIKLIYDTPFQALEIAGIGESMMRFNPSQKQAIRAAALKVEQGPVVANSESLLTPIYPSLLHDKAIIPTPSKYAKLHEIFMREWSSNWAVQYYENHFPNLGAGRKEPILIDESGSMAEPNTITPEKRGELLKLWDAATHTRSTQEVLSATGPSKEPHRFVVFDETTTVNPRGISPGDAGKVREIWRAATSNGVAKYKLLMEPSKNGRDPIGETEKTGPNSTAKPKVLSNEEYLKLLFAGPVRSALTGQPLFFEDGRPSAKTENQKPNQNSPIEIQAEKPAPKKMGLKDRLKAAVNWVRERLAGVNITEIGRRKND